MIVHQNQHSRRVFFNNLKKQISKKIKRLPVESPVRYLRQFCQNKYSKSEPMSQLR
jgi:hypothetical protein